MHYDPLTIVVAPTLEGSARGTLYLDDEATLAHETAGAFVYRQFKFENNIFTCAAAATVATTSVITSSQARSSYRPPNTVERVEIANQMTPPKRVVYRSNSQDNTQPGVEIFAYYDPDRKVLTIKKPDGNVADDWSLTLEY